MPASSDPREIGSDLLFIHEGQGADLHVMGELCRREGIQGFQFLSLNGHSKLRGFLKALARSPHFRSPVPGYSTPVRAMAIVLDAEGDAAAAFAKVADALASAGLPAPAAAGQVTAGVLKVGVFLVPDNVSPGMIETLCLRSVAADPAWECLDVFFRCVESNGGTLPANIDKARAQAFLSTRPQPDLPVGLAALEGYWDFAHETFKPLIDFLRRLA